MKRLTEIPRWKLDFINKHLDCIGENCIAAFDIYNDSAFSKDLDALHTSAVEECVEKIESAKGINKEVNDLLDSIAKDIRSK